MKGILQSFYSGSSDKNTMTLHFWLIKKFKNEVSGFEPMSERLCVLRAIRELNVILIIRAYATTEEKDKYILFIRQS
jgi:hypothetical protein